MRILFFSPYGGRYGGADVTLWNTFEYLDRAKYEPFLFCNHPPSLMDERQLKIPFFVSKDSGSVYRHFLDRLNQKVFNVSSYEKEIMRVHKKLKPDIWYINSASILHRVAHIAGKHRIPYVAHFHELLSNFVYLKEEELKSTVQNARLLIGCSEIACRNLEVLNGKNIHLFYESVKVGDVKSNAAKVKEIRNKLNIPPGAFVWAMSGFTQYRKGLDFIPEIMARMANTDMHFIWIGRVNNSGYDYFMQEEIKKKGISNFHLVGEQADEFYDYMDCADAFVLTSREDAFPLVMIEAAALGKPIVSFNSGGVREFLKEGMGKVVDSWNISDLTDAMLAVMNKKILCNPDASKARASAFDIKTQIANWEQIMDSIKPA